MDGMEQWWPDRGPDLRGNKGVVGRFVKRTVKDVARSSLAGKLITKDALFAELKGQASKDIFAAEVKGDNVDHWKARLPEAWAAFESGYQLEVDGTPLTDIPLLTSERAILLSMAGINTAEQLRDAPPHVIAKIQLGRELQRAAVEFFSAKEVAATPTRRRSKEAA